MQPSPRCRSAMCAALKASQPADETRLGVSRPRVSTSASRHPSSLGPRFTWRTPDPDRSRQVVRCSGVHQRACDRWTADERRRSAMCRDFAPSPAHLQPFILSICANTRACIAILPGHGSVDCSQQAEASRPSQERSVIQLAALCMYTSAYRVTCIERYGLRCLG
jgi:hypothetical protein